jgi:hypothetical protein
MIFYKGNSIDLKPPLRCIIPWAHLETAFDESPATSSVIADTGEPRHIPSLQRSPKHASALVAPLLPA